MFHLKGLSKGVQATVKVKNAECQCDLLKSESRGITYQDLEDSVMEGDTSEEEVPYEVDPEWIPAMQSDDSDDEEDFENDAELEEVDDELKTDSPAHEENSLCLRAA